RISRACARFFEDLAARWIERSRAVPLDRIRLRRRVALSLAGDDVQKLRAAQLFHVAQGSDEPLDVVAVDWSDIVEAHLLEQGAGQNHSLEVLLGAARQLPHRGHLAQDL